MGKSLIAISLAALLAGCGQGKDAASTNAAASVSKAKKKAAYCFFEDQEMKGWSAKRRKDGNIVVKGKAFREDPRYKAAFGPSAVTGTTAEISPTILQNDTGFASPDNWWDFSETIANSAAVTSVAVTCGDKTLTTLNVPAKS